jgi:hypothetical protein
MPDVLNSCARIFADAQVILGTCTVTGGVPAITQLWGFAESDQLQVSVADTATGKFTFTVQNFQGQNSCVAAQVTAIAGAAEDYQVEVFSQALSGSTATFVISTLTAGSAADGASFNFTFWAF